MAKLFRLVSCLLLCVLGARSLVLQRPATISWPLVGNLQLYLCNADVRSATNLSTPLPPWRPENPPSSFAVEFKYISRTRDLDKFSVWLGIVINIARVGINRWNLDLPRQISFPESNNFLLQAVSSATPPRYQTKSMIWTLQEAFEEYNKRGQYSSASLRTRVNGQPLGFATIKSTLTDGQQLNTVIPSSQVGRRGLDIRLDYTPNGAIFTDFSFIYTVINLLAYAANGDPKTQATDGIVLYNSDEDYTLSIQPMSADARDDLPLERLIQAIGALPMEMYEQQRGGRWAELKGVVKFDGVNIGRIKVKKGQHVDPDACMKGNGTATS